MKKKKKRYCKKKTKKKQTAMKVTCWGILLGDIFSF